MKVAITTQEPTLAGTADPKFGRSRFLFLVDTDTNQFALHDPWQDTDTMRGAGSQGVWKAMEEGVDAVISGSCGPKAFTSLRARGIGVYVGAHGTVKDAVQQFESGQLVCISKANVERHQISVT